MKHSLFFSIEHPQFRVQSFRHTEDLVYPTHLHSESSIVICTSGVLESTQLGFREVMGPGDVLFTNREVPHSSHYLAATTPTTGVTIDLTGGTMAYIEDQYCPTVPLAQSIFLGRLHMPEVAALATRIDVEMREGQPGHALMLQALSLQIIVNVFRSWPKDLVRPLTHQDSKQLPRHLLVRSVEAMSVSGSSLTMKSLAHSLGSSESAFGRLFGRSVGMTPARFHRLLIMQRAAAMLRDKDRSVRSVAYELGFRSSSHFTASFREHWGAPPISFRTNASVQ